MAPHAQHHIGRETWWCSGWWWYVDHEIWTWWRNGWWQCVDLQT